ncbi:DUF6262 family protein [Salinibacterium hongtaonis]|uniref:Transposase n=1 Tax=Homoserinimonas hongtaonis TaxID=2079791 RepID=A0A2U1T2U1_9MICO|nr:DUF6262 family protein [Salinibacterium hongtaonis]PWB98189.1 hypothetical protein DF220_10375 [Salinibacterium hongtaonis]
MNERLVAAAQARSKASADSVVKSLRRHEERNQSVSISSVASDAGVSRNFIYSTPKLRALVEAARTDPHRRPAQSLSAPGGSTGSADSLRTRLAAALRRIESIEAELDAVKRENSELIAEVMELQNPQAPKNVQPIRPRRF